MPWHKLPHLKWPILPQAKFIGKYDLFNNVESKLSVLSLKTNMYSSTCLLIVSPVPNAVVKKELLLSWTHLMFSDI